MALRPAASSRLMLTRTPSFSGAGAAIVAMVWLRMKMPRLATFCLIGRGRGFSSRVTDATSTVQSLRLWVSAPSRSSWRFAQSSRIAWSCAADFRRTWASSSRGDWLAWAALAYAFAA